MDAYLSLFDMIGALARRRYLMAERDFAVLGFNHTEARLLTLLDESKGEATQERLSDQLLLDRSNAGRALKRLERDGYVERQQDEADKRAKLVRMTDKGHEAVSRIAALRVEMARSFFGDLSEEEARGVARLLERALTAEL